MAEEERMLRFENALTTLSELTGKQDARIAGIAQSVEILVRLALSADERMNQQLAWINQLGAAQANADARIAALADAQIRTEETQANTDAKMAALADAQIRTEEMQASTDARMAALADAQIRTEEARAESDTKMAALADAQIRTEEALTRLAEAQAHTDQRLDALIDIVREGRNGTSR